MRASARFFAIFISITFVCYVIKVESFEIARRQINIKSTCLQVNVTFHNKLTCHVDEIDVISQDNSSFQLTNLTVINRAKDFFRSIDFVKETCFKDEVFHGFEYLALSGKDIINIVATSRIVGDYIFDVTCSKFDISVYDSEIENLTDSCTVKPLGLDVECSLNNYKLYLKSDVVLQITPDNNFTIASATVMSSKRNESGKCEKNEGPFGKQFTFNLTSEDCHTVGSNRPPWRCVNSDWNIYAWKKCSKLAFGSKVLHLDGRFDHLVFNNLTSFCEIQFPEMKNCTRQNPACNTPNIENGRYYKRLEKSYDEICSNIDKFKEGSTCMKNILSDDLLKDDYLSELNKCSAVESDGICVKYSNELLCSARAQHLALSYCTSLSTAYKYQKLLKDRDYANSNCSTVDPCLIMETKYEDLCSGHSHLGASILSIMVAVLFNFISSVR